MIDIDAGGDTTSLLRALTVAYEAGDAPRAEHLLLLALDKGLAWDAVCAAAARGVARTAPPIERLDA